MNLVSGNAIETEDKSRQGHGIAGHDLYEVRAADFASRRFARFARIKKWTNQHSTFVSSKVAAYCLLWCASCSCILVCLEALNLLVGKSSSCSS
jgi:hypothetical protein